MEAMLGISVYPSLSNLAKMLHLSYYLLCFLFKKLEKRAEQVLPGSKEVGGRQGREVGGKVERWPK
jgi:hypothetical protein